MGLCKRYSFLLFLQQPHRSPAYIMQYIDFFRVNLSLRNFLEIQKTNVINLFLWSQLNRAIFRVIASRQSRNEINHSTFHPIQFSSARELIFSVRRCECIPPYNFSFYSFSLFSPFDTTTCNLLHLLLLSLRKPIRRTLVAVRIHAPSKL